MAGAEDTAGANDDASDVGSEDLEAESSGSDDEEGDDEDGEGGDDEDMEMGDAEHSAQTGEKSTAVDHKHQAEVMVH